MATTFLGIFQLADRDDPLANLKSLRLWLSQLSINDPVGSIEAATRLLERPSSTQSESSFNRLRTVLELDRVASPMHGQLRAQYRLASLSEDVRQHLWRVCDQHARAFAALYERIAAEHTEPERDERMLALLHGVYARLFHYV